MGGWRRSGSFGPWPGRGPFSHLPPWERPGWLYGPGACQWLYGASPYIQAPAPSAEADYLKDYMAELKMELESIEARIKQLEAAEIKK